MKSREIGMDGQSRDEFSEIGHFGPERLLRRWETSYSRAMLIVHVEGMIAG